MEWRWRDLKGLEATISQYESSLGGARVHPEGTLASEDDLSNSGAEGTQEMATTPVAEDAPAVSATPESLTSPPGEEQTCPWRWMMEMITYLQLAPSPTGRVGALCIRVPCLLLFCQP